MKKLKIYYLNSGVEALNEDRTEIVDMDLWQRYLSLSDPLEDEKQPEPKHEEYKTIFKGSIADAVGLETIYINAQNTDFSTNNFAKDRSMKIGDLVELDGELYICAPDGFDKTQWAD